MIEIDLGIAKRLARSEMKRLIDMYVLLHRAQILKREAAAACAKRLSDGATPRTLASASAGTPQTPT